MFELASTVIGPVPPDALNCFFHSMRRDVRVVEGARFTYFDHCDDIDGRIANDQALVRAVRERTPSNTSGEDRSLHGEALKQL